MVGLEWAFILLWVEVVWSFAMVHCDPLPFLAVSVMIVVMNWDPTA